MNFYVAGVKHHKFYEIAEDLKEGDSVQLIPEPNNKYDKFAVRIEALKTMLGYVPANVSEIVSNAIANSLFNGESLPATVIEVSLEAQPWSALKLKVKMPWEGGTS